MEKHNLKLSILKNVSTSTCNKSFQYECVSVSLNTKWKHYFGTYNHAVLDTSNKSPLSFSLWFLFVFIVFAFTKVWTHCVELQKCSAHIYITVICSIMMLQWITDHVYDGGPLKLYWIVGWGCGSGLECLPSMCEALSLILRSHKKINKIKLSYPSTTKNIF